MSGFLGQMLQGVLGGGQQGQASPIAGILQQVLSVKDGDKQGVAAIISKFQSAGLGQPVQSWVGTGQNAPVSGNQVGQVFSQNQIEGWAQQAGTTPDAMRDVLAQALPHVIDHATPGGQVPAQTTDLSGLIGRLFGGAGTTR
ncbi:YidB family protein [Rhodopila sp.]|uniref:YidB family protein n=1 Tax=Rhodopila sp. TaxID=2480087 RepID=UPI003D11C463